MSLLESLIAAIDLAYWELGEAFSGLPDEDVWKRPHPRLHSVGEIASHIAFGEDVGFTGGWPDNPFLERCARYYPTAIATPLVMDMKADEVYRQLQRVHENAKQAVLALQPDLDSPNPHREGWTWRQALEYTAFHVAYHTGQIYSARHLLGHETVDN